ncbi:phage tail protein [Syntrophotalea acetylenica]|uniref:phage tail protein n=1 Tax=Syntrophotalea acetylenica TaxID=29542 RepID=UPI00090A55BE|nr:phage tail protein [Syntrophotalea acetylenica]APG45459.1 hypothetical protein A6070_14865 [Syntrophotalea acetylenica]
MLSIKLEGIEQAMRMFDPKVVSPAASQAINDAARAGRAEAARALLGKWNLKAGKVNAELKNIKFARIGDLTATIQAKGRPISLQYFGFKEVRRTVKGKGGKYRQVKGVTGSVLKAGGGKSYPGAFTATMLSGHNGVFMTEKRFFGLSDYGYNKPTRAGTPGSAAGRLWSACRPSPSPPCSTRSPCSKPRSMLSRHGSSHGLGTTLTGSWTNDRGSSLAIR